MPFVLDGWENKFADVMFVCKICKKPLPGDAKARWKTHFKTHSEQHDFICPVCGKGFHTKFNMERHKKVHDSLDEFGL